MSSACIQLVTNINVTGMANQDKIELILMNETAYVWKTEDWLRLRSLRIVGNFVGNLAALPRQDQMTGLPLALLKEETMLLLEKGYGIIKKFENLSDEPKKLIQEKSTAYRQKLLSEETELFVNKRKEEIASKIDVILEGKKAKRKCTSSDSSSSELNKELVLEEEFKKIQQPKQTSLAVQLFIDDPWLEDEEFSLQSFECLKNDEEKLRYTVFKDLWEKGYYITAGGKFGGDFLVYPGDPVKFHAFFIIICVGYKQNIGMNEIITYGRLGQSVRKTVSLAYVDDTNEVKYQSLQWAGF